MKKFNNKGFALVETLIVSAFVMGIFTLLFTNFYPMMGEYEKRENYDDIDSVYKTYFIKRMIEKYGYGNMIGNTGNRFSCSQLNSTSEEMEYCHTLLQKFNIDTIVLTAYKIDGFKNQYNSSSLGIDSDFEDYIKYLPNFNNNSFGNRIIVEYNLSVNNESGSGKKTINKFSTIGVDIHG